MVCVVVRKCIIIIIRSVGYFSQFSRHYIVYIRIWHEHCKYKFSLVHSMFFFFCKFLIFKLQKIVQKNYKKLAYRTGTTRHIIFVVRLFSLCCGKHYRTPQQAAIRTHTTQNTRNKNGDEYYYCMLLLLLLYVQQKYNFS